MGYFTEASGAFSTAMGGSTTASGHISTAMGSETEATGNYSTAMGYKTIASNSNATAMGSVTTASGDASLATGVGTTASGDFSTAMGSSTTASGSSSTAMGTSVSTDNKTGSFIIGDYQSLGTTTSTAANQMMMRFRGGYRLYTNGATTLGVSLAAGGNSWVSISDETKKENYQEADGTYFLESIKKMKLGSWNYIG